MKRLCAIAAAAAAIVFGVHGRAQDRMIEWPYYGGQQAHTKYSLAADITPANVGRLAPAWQWAPAEKAIEGGTRPGLFENTPLMIDNGTQNILRQPMARQQRQRVRARIEKCPLVTNEVDQESVAQTGAGQDHQTVVGQYVARQRDGFRFRRQADRGKGNT